MMNSEQGIMLVVLLSIILCIQFQVAAKEKGKRWFHWPTGGILGALAMGVGGGGAVGLGYWGVCTLRDHLKIEWCQIRRDYFVGGRGWDCYHFHFVFYYIFGITHLKKTLVNINGIGKIISVWDQVGLWDQVWKFNSGYIVNKPW